MSFSCLFLLLVWVACKKASRELPGRPSNDSYLEDAYREIPGAAAMAATATFMEARMDAQK
jgi:hypothetical protein